MTAKAKQFDVEFRPHFKTHQSHEIGRWIRNEGVNGITVSSPTMALYFSEDGWDDITIAFPFYSGMIPDLKKLEKSSELRLFIHSPEQLSLLEKELTNDFRFYIEIDGGYGRSGISINNKEKIDEIIKSAEGLSKCSFHGFYIHDGRTYQARSAGEIKVQISESLSALESLKSEYPYAKISLGDTPSASELNNLEFLDEMTAGNFVFYDWMQVHIGSCSIDDVALFVSVPVAQSINMGKQAIVHGGAVHFSKDSISVSDITSFGQAIKMTDNEIIPIEGCYLSALSQEHGTFNGYDLYPDKEHILICPVHSCLTANLFKEYNSFNGEIIEKRILS